MTKSLMAMGTLLLMYGCGQPDVSEQPPPRPGKAVIFAGTYTKAEPHVDGQALGIYTLLAAPDGALQPQDTATGIINPSYLAVGEKKKVLIAVSETGGDVDTTGYVYAYRIGPGGALELLNRQPSYGFAPCYVALSADEAFAGVVNYAGATAVLYPLGEDGSLGPAAQVLELEGNGPHPEQDSPHAHSLHPAPDGPFWYLADKGSDKVLAYRLEGGQLLPAEQAFVKLPPGAGPRHMAFGPGRLYVVNELSSTVTVFARDSLSGELSALQDIEALPEGYDGFNACADIHLSPDGRHLYASNRGHNSLAIYEVGTAGLKLLGFQPTGGDFPRSFLISPDGSGVWVANQNAGGIHYLERHAETGLLTPKGSFSCTTPVCLKYYQPQ